MIKRSEKHDICQWWRTPLVGVAEADTIGGRGRGGTDEKQRNNWLALSFSSQSSLFWKCEDKKSWLTRWEKFRFQLIVVSTRTSRFLDDPIGVVQIQFAGFELDVDQSIDIIEAGRIRRNLVWKSVFKNLGPHLIRNSNESQSLSWGDLFQPWIELWRKTAEIFSKKRPYGLVQKMSVETPEMQKEVKYRKRPKWPRPRIKMNKRWYNRFWAL